MSEFKVGDKVRCVDASGCGSSITFGNIYAVHNVTADYVTVLRDDFNFLGAYERYRFVPFEPATTAPQTPDKINPPHYAQYPIQPITFIRALNLNHNRGAIVKYASRAGYKANEDAIDDLKKIIRYAEAEIKAIEIERGDKDWSKGI